MEPTTVRGRLTRPTLDRVAVVLVTGMSGVGKSAVLAELARRGHRVVDTDHGGLSVEVPLPGGSGVEQLWCEDRIDALLDRHSGRHSGGHSGGTLFVGGCVRNQGRFYQRFDAIVLLSAPLEIILERVRTRRSNDFGKTGAQRRRIADDHADAEPLLRNGATAEIDTRLPLDQVADRLESIASAAAGAASQRRSRRPAG